MSVSRLRFLHRASWARWLRQYRGVVIFAAAALAIGVGQLGIKMGFIPMLKLEEDFIDFKFRLRGNVPGSPDCVLVGVNDSSLDPSNFSASDFAGSEGLRLMSGTFPWNRKVWALLLDRLMAAGARTVVFDFLFVNPAEGDDELAAALKKYGDRVVIGAAFVEKNPDTTQSTLIYKKPEKPLLEATPARITGCSTLPVDTLDQVIRRTWYWTSELRQYGYDDNSREIISMAGLGALKFNPKLTLPEGTHLINYQGIATTYPYLPIEELFMDRIYNTDPRYSGGKVFKDKIVFVGPVAETFHDVHDTPYGLMPGVEIHAQIAGSLLQGTALRDVPDWLALALSIPMGLIGAWAGLRLTHALGLSGFMAVGAMLFITIAQWLFVKEALMIPMVRPLFSFAGTVLFALVLNFLLEQMERARIRAVLDRYVSPNIAALVLAERNQFEKALLGQRRKVTALFSDIRGFTTMTEERAPEDLVEQMNEYFGIMVEAVLDAEGTLQKFIGDAVMAVWGDTHPLEPASGARQAVRTALAMSAGLDELNRAWSGNQGRQPFSIGIGVSHGEVIVGSMGHPRRMEFTVIGDGINTAARLEAATKQFGCRILVGEAVEALTRNEFRFRKVGLIKFKGKLRAIEVFTPLGVKGASFPAWIDGYHAGIELYRAGAFMDARAAFQEAKAAMEREDRLCEMYLKECEICIDKPPDGEWDAAWTLTEK